MKDILFGLLLLACIVNSSCVSIGDRELNSKPFVQTVDQILARYVIHKSDLNLKGDVKSTFNPIGSNIYPNPKTNSRINRQECFKSIAGLKGYDLKNTDDFEYFQFNKAGYVTMMVQGSCEFGQITTYEYDGNLLTKHTVKNTDGSITDEMNFIYDTENRLIEFDLPNRPTNEEGKGYIRYGNNFLTFYLLEKNINNAIDTFIILFDKNDNEIDQNPLAQNYFDVDSNLVKSISPSKNNLVIKYDQVGNKIRESKYDSLNHLIKSERYEYNLENKLLYYSSLDANGYIVETLNSSGKRIKFTRLSDLKAQYDLNTILNSYDLNYNVIQPNEIGKDKNIELEKIKQYYANEYHYNDSLTRRIAPETEQDPSASGYIIEYYE